MAKMKSSNEIIRNFMEDMVADTIDGVIKNMDVCGCEKCRMDITAIALNNLPPKYVVTRKGQLFTKLSVLQHQFDADLTSAISKAAVIVSENPRHNTEEQ
ncbi:MAG: late competence development ComFB family protein [Clostridiales bacterium]|jgi:competence protein ComFB|nr:late competence development ComFB family protein [Clostridiales bacterium]